MSAPVFRGLTNTIQKVYKEPIEATYTPSAGPATGIKVIFLALHRELDLNGIPYGDARPVAWATDTEVPLPKFGEGLLINGQQYTIREMEHDGLESWKLVLSRS
jgi:hypothetical protein